MIRGEPLTVGATITCLVTLCATNSWSVTWSRHFQSDRIKTDRGRKHAHFVARAHAPSIFQECRDYRLQKCHDQVSDQELGANQNVTKQ